VRTEIQDAMTAASDRLDFEAAAVYRDRLAALSHVQGHQGINPRGIEEADVFAIHRRAAPVLHPGVLLPHRPELGQPRLLSRADRELEPGSVLGAFLAQFYDDKPVPRLVLLSHEIEEQALLEEALSEKSGRKVAISVPQRGEKKDLVERALTNAREALGRAIAETASQKTLLAGLAETFGLAAPPQRIEVYDNSHIMGTNPVGGMIVAGPEGS
jgi:excinuclease ABC subunit C